MSSDTQFASLPKNPPVPPPPRRAEIKPATQKSANGTAWPAPPKQPPPKGFCNKVLPARQAATQAPVPAHRTPTPPVPPPPHRVLVAALAKSQAALAEQQPKPNFRAMVKQFHAMHPHKVEATDRVGEKADEAAVEGVPETEAARKLRIAEWVAGVKANARAAKAQGMAAEWAAALVAPLAPPRLPPPPPSPGCIRYWPI